VNDSYCWTMTLQWSDQSVGKSNQIWTCSLWNVHHIQLWILKIEDTLWEIVGWCWGWAEEILLISKDWMGHQLVGIQKLFHVMFWMLSEWWLWHTFHYHLLLCRLLRISGLIPEKVLKVNILLVRSINRSMFFGRTEVRIGRQTKLVMTLGLNFLTCVRSIFCCLG